MFVFWAEAGGFVPGMSFVLPGFAWQESCCWTHSPQVFLASSRSKLPLWTFKVQLTAEDVYVHVTFSRLLWHWLGNSPIAGTITSTLLGWSLAPSPLLPRTLGRPSTTELHHQTSFGIVFCRYCMSVRVFVCVHTYVGMQVHIPPHE